MKTEISAGTYETSQTKKIKKKYFKLFNAFDRKIDNALAVLKGEKRPEKLSSSKQDFYKQKIKAWANKIKA